MFTLKFSFVPHEGLVVQSDLSKVDHILINCIPAYTEPCPQAQRIGIYIENSK